MNEQQAEMLRLAATLLRQQAQWGLDGVEVGADCLLRTSTQSAPTVDPRAALKRSAVAAPTRTPTPSSYAPSSLAPSSSYAPSSLAPSHASVPANSSATRVDRLAGQRARIAGCQRCPLSQGRTNIVFGTGAADARLMFVGGAPGRDEDLQAEPFVGAAGQLLDRMIAAMGLRRSSVYIANVAMCRPPRDRDLAATEIGACLPFLLDQIGAVRPEVVVALGETAAQGLLQSQAPFASLRGVWHQTVGHPAAGVAVMPTFHPAHLLRHPDAKKVAWADLQAVLARLADKRPG